MRDWGKPQKISTRTAGLQAKIWTWDLQNMKQEFGQTQSDVRVHNVT
jgi:hypothetical protein